MCVKLRQNKVIPFFIIAVLMVSSMAVSAAYAHAPTAVTLTPTETTILISWTHSGDAGQDPVCVEGRSLSTCLTDVDVMRLPGQTASTANTTTVSNSTAYMVINNATGLSSFTDHSLPEGTVFSYQVCHTEADGGSAADPTSLGCTEANTDGTNAGTADEVFTTTKASAVNGTSINFSMAQNSAVVNWTVPPGNNNTAVGGLKIEYSLDGGFNIYNLY